jgi:hypothetical protein
MHNHINAEDPQRQRIVILPGPHKSGTTSVQSFLDQLQKNNQLGHFEWPGNGPKAFAGVSGAILFHNNSDSGKHSNAEVKSLRKIRERLRQSWSHGKSIVFGAENMDAFATLSPEQSQAAMSRLQSILPTNNNSTTDIVQVQVVVMYRTPKSSHLISVWKQQTAKDVQNRFRKKIPKSTNAAPIRSGSVPVPTLAEWLCTGQWRGKMQYDVPNLIASQTNPMGVADTFLKSRGNNMTVFLADMMSGMDDLSQGIVCEILQLPSCNSDGKVAAAEAEIKNQRSNPTHLGMTDAELEQVERILRKMDCYYYCGMLRDKITVLHAKDEMLTSSQGWNQCCDRPSENLSPSEAYKQLHGLACRSAEGSSSLPNPRNNNTTVFFEKRHQSTDNTSDKKEEQELQQPDALESTEPTRLFLPHERMRPEKVVAAKPAEDLLLVGDHSNGMELLLLPSFAMSFLFLLLVVCRFQKCTKRRRRDSVLLVSTGR